MPSESTKLHLCTGFHLTAPHLLSIASSLLSQKITDIAQAHSVVSRALKPLNFKIPPANSIPRRPDMPPGCDTVQEEAVWVFCISDPLKGVDANSEEGEECCEKAVAWLEKNGFHGIGKLELDLAFCEQKYFED